MTEKRTSTRAVPTFERSQRRSAESRRDLQRTQPSKEHDDSSFAVLGKFACIIIPPFSPRKMIWDMIGVALLQWTIILTPLRLGFDVEDFCPSSIWVWEFTIDCFFMMDLMLNFFTAVYVESDGAPALSSDMCDIARDYLKHWFSIDLVSSLPVDAILSLVLEGCNGAPNSSESSSKLGALSMVRILRLVKLFRIFRALKLQARSARCIPSLSPTARNVPRSLSWPMPNTHSLSCQECVVSTVILLVTVEELTDSLPFFVDVKILKIANTLLMIVFVAQLREPAPIQDPSHPTTCAHMHAPHITAYRLPMQPSRMRVLYGGVERLL